MRRFPALLAIIAAFGICLASGPLEEVERLAASGDADALFRLATVYDNGYDTIGVDSLRSSSLYLQSAQAGNVAAMNQIGYRLLKGEGGMERDIASGLGWLVRAAEAGDPKAASNLGWLLIDGGIVEADEEKGAMWLGKAAEAGLPVAQSLLGDLYRDGRGVTRDSLMADSLYREAFERGLADAGYRLYALNSEKYASLPAQEMVKVGKYYYLRGVPSAGVKLFYLASEKGDADAMALLGDAYTRAQGVPYDYRLSLRYYARGANGGNAAAQFVIAELLDIFPDALDALVAEGDVPPMSDDPSYWYEKAALQGVTDASGASAYLLEESPEGNVW